MLLKELTDIQKQILSDLIQMKAPDTDWLTPESKKETYKVWDTHQNKLLDYTDDFHIRKVLSDMFNLEGFHDGVIARENHGWNTICGALNTKNYYLWWKHGQLISLSNAQDPKYLTQDNLNQAAQWAAIQWNGTWIDPGHMNLELWSVGGVLKFVFQPIDFEHRLWGMIGFQLGVVPLGIKGNSDFTPEPMILPDGSEYDPTDKLLPQICADTNLTEEQVLNRFTKNKMECVFAAMKNDKEKSFYFRQKNSSHQKTKLQMSHSHKSKLNDNVKSNSSIKNHNDKSTYDRLHPFFEHNYRISELYNLKSYEHAMLVGRFVENNYDYIESSKAASLKWIEESKHTPTDEYNKNVDECLNFLFDLCKSGDVDLNNNKMLDVLRINDLFKRKGKYISCLTTFGKALMKFYKEKSYDDNDEQTKFGMDLNSVSKLPEHNKRYDILWNEFLEGLKDNDRLKEIGVVDIPVTLPRTYNSDAKDKNLKEHDNKDIDDRTLNGVDSKHGGHIIPEFLLARLNETERKELFADETERLSPRGYNPITDFDTNLRTMSSRHNLLMKHLRLSDYLEILDKVDITDNTAITKAVAEKLEDDFYREMKNKPVIQL